MKKIILFILIISATLCLALTAYAADGGGQIFNMSEWAREEVIAARDFGILTDSIYFKDYKSSITRADFCDLVISIYEKINGNPVKNTNNIRFTDTNNPNVIKAYSLGIVSGGGNMTFDPYRDITREEVAKILSGLLDALKINRKRTEISTDKLLEPFGDSKNVADWAKPYVANMVDTGYMKGTSEFTLSPKEKLSIEEAILLSYRLFISNKPENQTANSIVMLSDVNEAFVPSGKVSLSWTQDKKSIAYSVYVYNSDGYKVDSISIPNSAADVTLKNIQSGNIEYYLAVKSEDNVFSAPIHVYATEENIIIRNKRSFYNKYDGAVISWKGVDEAVDYEVEIDESRSLNNELIPPRPTRVERTGGATSLWLDTSRHRDFEIRVFAVDKNNERMKYSDTLSFNTGGYQHNDAAEFWGDDPIAEKEDADRQMKTIKINVWKIGKNNTKVASTAQLTVNYRIADAVYAVFEEIFNGAEKFPIQSVGAYSWREPMSGGKLSEHNFGTAIDINSDQNYCVYSNGTVIGKYWKPGEDSYSITPYGEVMKSFERHGFTWGGDGWSNPKDYMHFSYLGG